MEKKWQISGLRYLCNTFTLLEQYWDTAWALLGQYRETILTILWQYSGTSLTWCAIFSQLRFRAFHFFVIHDICTFLKFIKIQNVKAGKKGNNCNHSLYLMWEDSFVRRSRLLKFVVVLFRTFNAGESGGIVKWTLGHVVVAASEQTDLASLSDRHALTVFHFCTILKSQQSESYLKIPLNHGNWVFL